MQSVAKTNRTENFQRDLNVLKDRFAAMQPELEMTVRDPSMGVEGYVVVWNTEISIGGPLERAGKGGTRIVPTLSMDEVKMLARTMALKNAAAGLPLGGSKSGLKADSTAPGFERKYRRFVQLCKPMLHENGGVFGGFGFDIGGKPEHALWACDELKSTRCFTGKPLSMGGTDYDREGIAGLGVAVAGKTALECHGKDPAAASYAIQGMGAMGAAVLRYFSETGARLRAFSDPRYGGTWMFDTPLSPALMDALVTQNPQALEMIAREGRKLSDSAEDVLYAEVDVLFPCAVQNVVTEANVARIKARYVIEGANGPVTEAARTALYADGVTVVPDFIANPGGIIAAFVELTSTAASKADEAKALTRAKIAANVRDMMAMAAEYGVEPPQAGLFMALQRIFNAAQGPKA
ncbi:MAG: Glu/Leu/Phe/Val dehydrogenase [Micavibrio aeruginosavorus]|nr:Glu/Leu/Phe/Val dehydrogenase [Micavibrio aeruginosavorus]